MCGIIGAVKRDSCVDDLIRGLRHVEYRGYDSAGISVHQEGRIHTLKRMGKLEQLTNALEVTPLLEGTSGIGHTRWATHGAPSCSNAHPHATQQVSVVHNGIIENHRQIRHQLEAQGRVFSSDTDSEVIPHLISLFIQQGQSCEAACLSAIEALRGSFALAVMFNETPDMLFAARRGSPLVLGRNEEATYLGSDSLALAGMASELIFMEEGDWAILDNQHISLHNREGSRVERRWVENTASAKQSNKQNYQHFMHKEIHEQPDILRKTLQSAQQQLRNLPFDISQLNRLSLIGCGTSHYAAQVARYWFERYAGLAVDVDIASEFRYRQPVLDPVQLSLFISQSGETADTLAALHYARCQGAPTVALVNVAHSSMARDADFALHTPAGPEIGVASTKAFSCQLLTLACLAIQAGISRGKLSTAQAYQLMASLATVPQAVAQVLQHEDQYRQLAYSLKNSRSAFFIGRGTSYPIAMEGALKLKEVSYIHAEGFGAGELKHGPISLIEPGVPVIVVAPEDDLIDKTLANMQEVRSRGGRCILFTDLNVIQHLDEQPADLMLLPVSCELTSPIVYTVAMQLLAYHVANARGTDIDQPRNLAKSVTVE